MNRAVYRHLLHTYGRQPLIWLGVATELIRTIAHRLSTVAGLDRIVVMEDGQIAEAGTHEQLLQLRGRYYSLWQKQITA